jgi:ABC-type nitrate/sulfonate/bicarbonate transport system substrate-binding protein
MDRRPKRLLVALAGIVVAMAVVAGCGGNDDSATEGEVIRFVQAPDPVWEVMKDRGIIEEWEQETGITVDTMDTFDYFALFVGGHADVVSANTYQTPLFDTRGIPTVTFGKYNASKDLLVVDGDSDYETAADLPEGCQVAVESLTGNAIIWSALVSELDGRELAENSDDLSFVVAETQAGPDLVEKGDVCAAITDPTQINPALRTGKVRPLYDGKSASELYGEEIVPGHFGVDTNDFVATKEWFDEHTEEAAAFLELWQQGVDLWKEDPDQIIEADPEGFGVQEPADSEFIKDYVRNTFDFFHDSVYLTEEFVEGERGVFDLIQDEGVIPEDQEYNEMAIIDPDTGEVTKTLP